MKKTISIIGWALVFSSSLLAQNYAPFNASVTKRFYNVLDTTDNNYFFYADSSDQTGSGILFYQYHPYQSPQPGFDQGSCIGWGSGVWVHADTSWLGNLM